MRRKNVLGIGFILGAKKNVLELDQNSGYTTFLMYKGHYIV